mgnify:CR=1 FL=1
METNERTNRREIRKKSTEKFILGLLFEVDAPKEQKEKTAREITTAIFESGCWDKAEFQKMTLGYLCQFSEKIPNEQLVAMSVKIARYI